jgi:hypothetical protein
MQVTIIPEKLKSIADFPKEILIQSSSFKKEFVLVDHREDQNTRSEAFEEYRPYQLHYIPDGTVNNRPVLAIAMENLDGKKIIGQVSVDMLNEVLSSIGYQIIKF